MYHLHDLLSRCTLASNKLLNTEYEQAQIDSISALQSTNVQSVWKIHLHWLIHHNLLYKAHLRRENEAVLHTNDCLGVF